MKLLFVLNNFLPEQVAGIEIYACALAEELQKQSVEVNIIIPNYQKNKCDDYAYDGLQIHQYAEPSIVDRPLIMGFRTPEGIQGFVDYIKTLQPDIIHFHEVAGSNGITLHHVKEVKKLGVKVLLTFHLSHYSCMTGTLMYMGTYFCDAIIDLRKCTKCYLNSKKINPLLAYFLSESSLLFAHLGIDPTRALNSFGTALGSSALVKKKHKNLLDLVSYSDRVVVLNDWYRDILIKNGVSSIKIIKISQGLPFSIKSSNVQKKPSRILRFLFVGRISTFKGLHLLIDAFMQIDAIRAELHIYGKADDLDYENKLKQLSISMPNIVWKGVLEKSEVVRVMLEYDAFCLCSTTSEMSPLVIQEAFAAGIPVIASNVYGNTEFIEHDVNGLLFNFNDSFDLLKQIKRCLNERDLLIKLSKNIKPPRSFSEVADEHLSLYKALLK